MCERALQVAAEITIDIAERIIAIENAGPVAGAAEAIEKLHILKIIESPEPYRSIARFRNLIAMSMSLLILKFSILWFLPVWVTSGSSGMRF